MAFVSNQRNSDIKHADEKAEASRPTSMTEPGSPRAFLGPLDSPRTSSPARAWTRGLPATPGSPKSPKRAAPATFVSFSELVESHSPRSILRSPPSSPRRPASLNIQVITDFKLEIIDFRCHAHPFAHIRQYPPLRVPHGKARRFSPLSHLHKPQRTIHLFWLRILEALLVLHTLLSIHLFLLRCLLLECIMTPVIQITLLPWGAHLASMGPPSPLLCLPPKTQSS